MTLKFNLKRIDKHKTSWLVSVELGELPALELKVKGYFHLKVVGAQVHAPNWEMVHRSLTMGQSLREGQEFTGRMLGLTEEVTRRWFTSFSSVATSESPLWRHGILRGSLSLSRGDSQGLAFLTVPHFTIEAPSTNSRLCTFFIIGPFQPDNIRALPGNAVFKHLIGEGSLPSLPPVLRRE